MPNAESTDRIAQLDALLATSRQSWLLGAGISAAANIPLMDSLTVRVLHLAQQRGGKESEILSELRSSLSDHATIEEILSQLADYAAIASRSKTKSATLLTTEATLVELEAVHQSLLILIADTIRWGYKPQTGEEPESVGNQDNPLVSIDEHLRFVSELIGRRRAGVAGRRKAIELFTTNYDTLIEDALALNRVEYWDGFSGGAVAHRVHAYGADPPPLGHDAIVVKLHGSIDWYLNNEERVFRVRDGDTYPGGTRRVLIYPQASKYVATQVDPFAAQFDLFRRALRSQENVVAICGYGFRDDHLNEEIRNAMQQPENNTTILGFSKTIPEVVKDWRNQLWSDRMYLVTESGLFVGSEGPFNAPGIDEALDWWTFSGVTRLLSDGAESYLP